MAPVKNCCAIIMCEYVQNVIHRKREIERERER